MKLTTAVVAPSEDSVEDTPAKSIGFVLWVAAIKVPDVANNIVGAGPVSSLGDVPSNLFEGCEIK